MCWPDGDAEQLSLGTALPRKIRFALDVDMKGQDPGVIVTTLDDEGIAIGSNGALLGTIGG
jgi:hypothetical protein